MDDNQQKTSFWDFWHKKAYTSRKEKLIDFLSGFIGIPVLFCLLVYLLEPVLSWFPIYYSFALFSIGNLGLWILIYLALMIYMLFKRWYIS